VTGGGGSLAGSVDLLLGSLLRLGRDEGLLVYLDERNDPRLAEALEEGACRRGGRAEFVELDSSAPVATQAARVLDRMERGGHRALLELADQYFYRTGLWERATACGARLFALPGLDADGFRRCVGGVDHARMVAAGEAIRRALGQAAELRVTSRDGTDLRMRLGLRRGRARLLARKVARRLRRAAGGVARRAGLFRLAEVLRPGLDPFLLPPGGLPGERGATFLGGQLALLGLPESIEGTVAVDGYLWPRPDPGPLEAPVMLDVEKGRIRGFRGPQGIVRLLRERFPDHAPRIEHLCIGFHPGARLGGSLLESERAMGCLTIGFGEGMLHTDGVLARPTLATDRGPLVVAGA
jgi:hypothetical protein